MGGGVGLPCPIPLRETRRRQRGRRRRQSDPFSLAMMVFYLYLCMVLQSYGDLVVERLRRGIEKMKETTAYLIELLHFTRGAAPTCNTAVTVQLRKHLATYVVRSEQAFC